MLAAARALWDERRLELLSPAVIFALAFIVRAALVFALRYDRSDLELNSEISHIAAQWARNFSFANPYPCPTGPTAHAAPAFPMILGLIYRTLARGSAREFLTCMVGTAVSSATYALLPWLAVSLGFRRITGVLAALFGAVVPLFLWIEARGIWDAPYVALFLVLCVAATVGLRPGVSMARVAAAGAAWGIAFWFAPSLLPVFLTCAAILFFRWAPSVRAVGVVLAVGLPALAIVSPWIVRNYTQFHSVFWIRDNFGLELHTSNNPVARPIEVDNREHTASFQVHPNGRPAACAVVQRTGEVAYFRQQQREATEWIVSHPGAFARLTFARAFYFWFVPLSSPVKRLTSAALTVLAIAGLALMWRKRAARLLVLILLAYSAVYYVIQVDPRFRYPLHPLILLGVSAGAYSVLTRSYGPTPAAETAVRRG